MGRGGGGGGVEGKGVGGGGAVDSDCLVQPCFLSIAEHNAQQKAYSCTHTHMYILKSKKATFAFC